MVVLRHSVVKYVTSFLEVLNHARLFRGPYHSTGERNTIPVARNGRQGALSHLGHGLNHDVWRSRRASLPTCCGYLSSPNFRLDFRKSNSLQYMKCQPRSVFSRRLLITSHGLLLLSTPEGPHGQLLNVRLPQSYYLLQRNIARRHHHGSSGVYR
jgi:hypothetical protein